MIQVPDTLQALRAACLEKNPVNIAGYGRESTHKGYLSWILTSDRNKCAVELVDALLKSVDVAGTLTPSHVSKCYCEQKLGSHRVDLLLDLIVESEPRPKKLAIELKTDAGPSSEKQFSGMTEFVNAQGYLGGFVLCLGSCSVQNHKWGTFRQIGPKELISLWSPLVGETSGFVRDWLVSLSHERARQIMAHQVYIDIVQKKLAVEDLCEYGYRSYKHLMYYVYDLFRDYVKKQDQIRTWSIYEGGYNAVLNLDECDDNWHKIPGLDNVRWFFEFNDDRFCLKLEHNSDEGDLVAGWAQKCLVAMKSTASSCPADFKKKATWRKGWPMIAYWKIDLTDFDKAYSALISILRDYGAAGALGKMEKG